MTGRTRYFERLRHCLRAEGIHAPVLIVDVDRLDDNISEMCRRLPQDMAYRIVAKSLPVPALLSHIRAKTGTNRLMTFNLPMLLEIAAAMPDAEQLLGKPLPVAAFRHILEQAVPDAGENICWLIDTNARLAEYEASAAGSGTQTNVVLELDVGLHRGGFKPGEALRSALEFLKASENLHFSGFMGYEPHLASVPKRFGLRHILLQQVKQRYKEALTLARDIVGTERSRAMLRNIAGSPTFTLHSDTSIGNEVAIGSALVKPTDFDIAELDDFHPATFIASPVLKSVGTTELPALGYANLVYRALSPGSAQSFFVHGGNWLADPVDPPGLRYNGIFGRSSNQEMLNGARHLKLEPDDFVFFRPRQSEAVFLQFGDILAYRDGAIVDRWPTFPISA